MKDRFTLDPLGFGLSSKIQSAIARVFKPGKENVCFWHKADIELLRANVRFWG